MDVHGCDLRGSCSFDDRALIGMRVDEVGSAGRGRCVRAADLSVGDSVSVQRVCGMRVRCPVKENCAGDIRNHLT